MDAQTAILPNLGANTRIQILMTSKKYSFRDPVGSVEVSNYMVRRTINQSYLTEVTDFLTHKFYQEIVIARQITASFTDANLSQMVNSAVSFNTIYHPLVPFIIYPYEWSAEMLHDAGQLTIALQCTALKYGFSLKDASAHNILFLDGRPILCDILSFSRLSDLPVKLWLAKGQFERHFILPFLAMRYNGTTNAQVFHTYRDGLAPNDIAKFMPLTSYLSKTVLGSVILPKLLTKIQRDPTKHKNDTKNNKPIQQPITVRQASSSQFQQFLYANLARNLGSKLGKAYKKIKASSHWIDYHKLPHYQQIEKEKKREIVHTLMQQVRPQWVLDIGANCGEFSAVGLNCGANVVALESDTATLNSLYHKFKGKKIYPLLANLARPSPGYGWLNRETIPLIDRLVNRKFDVVMVLAVIHHLLITERIPLYEILSLLAQIAPRYLIVEWVENHDVMFKQLAGVNHPLYNHLNLDVFLQSVAEFFAVQQVIEVVFKTRYLIIATHL